MLRRAISETIMKRKALPLSAFTTGGDHAPPHLHDDQAKLITLLSKHTPHDGGFDMVYGGVQAYRSTKIEAEKTHLLALPSICLVPQGSKAITYGEHCFEYDSSKMVVYAAEIPIYVNITQASKSSPYYCLVIPIHPARLHELVQKVFPHGVPKTDSTRAVYVSEIHPRILTAAVRMLDIIEQQDNADLLVPLVIDEILIHLLRSLAGPALAQIGLVDSHAEKISKAISWLKDNYANAIKVEELAKIVGMSVSSFHTHFKNLTHMSPLQFQKTLRLREARNLIRTKMMDVTHAALEVGYASPTQFSREYTREFGVPPSRDR